MTRRVIILLMDSLGIGASIDAKKYGDEGANTFGNIVKNYELSIPNLAALGLYHAAVASCGEQLIDLEKIGTPKALFGYAVEQSLGKDTPSGHWELAGVPVDFEWGYFAKCFPDKLLQDFIKQAKIPGVLGNKHASGTEIIKELGAKHLKTMQPIVYTSADSVFQIAAHEEIFGLDNLYRICEIARELVDEYNIGRVIARPFTGTENNFIRSANRKDYATPPHAKTLLDFLKEANREVISIGKVADIFAHRGITKTIKGINNQDLFDKTLQEIKVAPKGSLIFTNFVDFDSSYGHRRDVVGYAQALEAFDKKIPELLASLKPDDLVLISADHGCDPTFPGSDHTREHVPVLVFGSKITPGFIGRRESFADMGQSIAKYLDVTRLDHGISFL